jgi:FAD/FMN-containing dehydrogenase
MLSSIAQTITNEDAALTLVLMQLANELAPHLTGQITTKVPMAYQTDFGGVRHQNPGLLLNRQTEQDIMQAFQAAQAIDLPLTIRGAGHSCRGQSLSNGGILLRNYTEQAELTFMADGLVGISSRSRWRDVERQLNQAGRQVPILTDYLDLSVGGTLSVGGMGLNSIVHGFQVDNVVRLRLIRPDGQALWCSPQANAELFRFALAGLGQVGMIERVVMKTVPFQPYTHTLKRQHQSITEMLQFMPELLAPGSGVEHFNGYISLNEIASEYGYMSDRADLDVTRLADPLRQTTEPTRSETDFPFQMQSRRDVWMSAFPDHFQIWTDYIFDYAGLQAFMQFLEPLMQEEPLRSALKAIYILMIRRPENATNFALLPAAPGQPQLFSVGLYTMVPRWNPLLLAKTLPVLRLALQTTADLGGRCYLYGFNELDEGLKRQFYGADYDRLRELRQDYDWLNPNSF